MRKIALLLITLLSLSFFAGVSYAKDSSDEIPEVDGVYNDPGHPGVKVRVFVHRERPGQSQNSSLVCSLADPDSSTVDLLLPWKLDPTWTYRLNPSSVPSTVGSSNLATFAGIAFGTWTSATGSKVNFVRGADTVVSKQAYDGQNIVAWGRTSGSALAVTYTRYISSTGQVVDVDTIMNKKFAWKWTDQSVSPNCADSNSYDAQDILTHELGHWVGLDDHYTADYVNNTMYGYGSKGEVKKDTLTTGDKSGAFLRYN